MDRLSCRKIRVNRSKLSHSKPNRIPLWPIKPDQTFPSWYIMPRRKRRLRRKKWMEEPLTEELLDELLSSPDPKSFISKNEIGQRSLAEYLQKLLEEKGLKRSDVVKAAGLNETFGYQIFTGKRHTSRDKVLQLAFAMHLNLRETDRLLQAAGVNELYCKNRRDAIIIFAVNKGYSLQRTDEELYRFSEETIC